MEMIENRAYLPVPGWYSDPYGEGHDRWWDGETWSDQVNGEFAAALAVRELVSVGGGGAGQALGGMLMTGAEESFAPSGIGSYQMEGRSIPDYRDIALPMYDDSPQAYESAHRYAETATIEKQSDNYWLSTAALPKRGRTEETNPLANSGFALGILSVFLNPLFVVTIMGLRRSHAALRRATNLRNAGYKPVGMAKAQWGIIFSLIGTVSAVASIAAVAFLIVNLISSNAHFEKAAFEHTLAESVKGQEGITLTAVDCPVAASSVVSSKFQCVASKADGSKDVIYVQVLDDKGDISWKLGL
jgi:Protein of unknown function (DUF2510)